MDYKALEKQAERFAVRLSEVVNELGAYSNVMRQHHGKITSMEMPIDRIPTEFTTVLLSGYYCYHLSHEAHALIMILKEFLPALQEAYRIAGVDSGEENVASMKKSVLDIEPLIARTMDDMAPFQVMDVGKIIDELNKRAQG